MADKKVPPRSLGCAPVHKFMGLPTDGPRGPHGVCDQRRLERLAAVPSNEFSIHLDSTGHYTICDDSSVGVANREDDRATAAKALIRLRNCLSPGSTEIDILV